MCWNAEVSLNTFILGSIAAIIAIILNVVPYTLILLVYTVSLIQLMEYYTWTNINDKKIVYYLSIIGISILFLQVIILNYNYVKNKKERNVMYILIILFALSAILYDYINNKFTMEKAENGHLKWSWIDLPLPFIFIIIFLYLYPTSKSKTKISFVLTLITISISLYNWFKYKTWGSMWCYMANFLWAIIIIYSIIKKII
jgi:hypothetical protein